MQKITVAIIDDNEEYCKVTAEQMEKYYGDTIEVLGTANNGLDGINLLAEKKPDVALIDQHMPYANGFDVVDSLKSNEELRDITCIMLTGTTVEHMAYIAYKKGFDFVSLKPTDIDRLVNNIKSIYIYKKNLYTLNQVSIPNDRPVQLRLNDTNETDKINWDSPEKFAGSFLADMGFTPGIKGFYYLKTAICMCINDMSNLNMLTKVLYPNVAKVFGATGQQAERIMRHSIVSAWKTGVPQDKHSLRDEVFFSKKDKPSVGSLLRTVSNAYYANSGKLYSYE